MGIPRIPKKYTTGTIVDKFITQRSNRRGEHKNVPLSIDAVKSLLGVSDSTIDKIEEYDTIDINIGTGYDFATLLEANTYIAANPQLKYIWVKVYSTTGGTLNISNRELVKYTDASVDPSSTYTANISNVTNVIVSYSATVGGFSNVNKLFQNCGDVTLNLGGSIGDLDVENCNNFYINDAIGHSINELSVYDTQSLSGNPQLVISLLLNNSNCYFESQTILAIAYSGKSTLTQGTTAATMPAGYEYSTTLYDADGVLEYYNTDDNNLFISGTGNYSIMADNDSVIVASGNYSYAEGQGTTASNLNAHAEGLSTVASGNSSHAEGYGTLSSGNQSHAEGDETTASGNYSHSEGRRTTASGLYAHAEGYFTIAEGDESHAEGAYTYASGTYSHAGGRGGNMVEQVIASGLASFNHSQNTLPQTTPQGATAANSAILGGLDHHIPSTSTGSVILGGNGITAVDSDTVYSNNQEIIGSGNGIILASPDGTRYKLTIANGGTVNVAAV